MFPLRDVILSRTVPFVTIALIAANVFVLLYQLILVAAHPSGATDCTVYTD